MHRALNLRSAVTKSRGALYTDIRIGFGGGGTCAPRPDQISLTKRCHVDPSLHPAKWLRVL